MTPSKVGCLGRLPGGKLDSFEVSVGGSESGGSDPGGTDELLPAGGSATPAASKKVSSSGIEPSGFQFSSPLAIWFSGVSSPEAMRR